MHVAILSTLALAALAPLLCRYIPRLAGWLIALLPFALTAYFASFVPALAEGHTVAVSYPWIPSLGINFSLYLDGWSALFAIMITGIGGLVSIYAGGYLAGHSYLGRFYVYILMFMASMLGVVLADNAITLFVFWELTSLTSYFLIGFDHERDAARDAALQALVVTGGGGLALLVGLLLLGQVGGSLELSSLVGQGAVIRAHPLYPAILILILAGAFTKSAQVPFHFWLPNAMEAPTPVSAYLHSATMVKAGVYLVARLSPILGGTDAWHYLVTGAGIATMLVGVALVLWQRDLKRILAYSTVSTLGTLILLIGLDTTLSIKAASVFLLVHALYKGALFLVSGAVDHETGTRDVTRLGGLARSMPITAGAAVLAALSMAGLPPMLGFINKELLYEAKMQAPRAGEMITSAGVLANILLVAVAGVVGIRPFFGRRKETPKKPHEAPIALWLGPAVLGGLGLINGLLPDAIPTALVTAAVNALRAEPSEVKLALWHGFSPIVLLSALTVLCGVGLYVVWDPLTAIAARLWPVLSWGPQRWYTLALQGLNTIARVQTRVLQSGYLRYYLLTIIGTTLLLGGYTLVTRHGLAWPRTWLDVRFYEVAVPLLMLAAMVVALRSPSRLGAIAALGVVGYGVAIIFTFYSAPDLAMTQFMIETLTVILLVLVFYHLPPFSALSSARARLRDAVAAIAAGAFMAALVLVAGTEQFNAPVSDYLVQESLVEAHGRDVVNVILVDFRALDTLGEITVLALAAVGVYALLKLRMSGGKEE